MISTLAKYDAFSPYQTDERPCTHMRIDGTELNAKFDGEPFGFSHNLSGLAMFREGALRDLAARFDAHPADYFVAASAPRADSEFFGVPRGLCKPTEAMNRLQSSPIRVLLKRPENHDPAFRRLLDELFAQVMALRGGLRGERLVRLESSVFITSAASTTPCHFDPEIAFFSQIEGEKVYHVFSPSAMREPALEKFYLQGLVSIGEVDLHKCDQALERVYNLRPGMGLHQPQNSPHWVQTRGSRSVSYAFVFETDASRARGHARACNHYIRKLGFNPSKPGERPATDCLKAGAMRALIPMRKQLAAAWRSLRAPPIAHRNS
jgi:hypothetical protein